MTRGGIVIGDVGSYAVSGVYWRERWRRSPLRFLVAGGLSLDNIVVVVNSFNTVKVAGVCISTSIGRRSSRVGVSILISGGLGCWGDRWNLLVSVVKKILRAHSHLQ